MRRVLPAAVSSLFAASLLVVSAPAAGAQSAPTLTVEPSPAAIGQTITISGTAAPAACAGPVGLVVVSISGAGEVLRVAADTFGAFSGEAVVPDLDAGSHQVTSRCEVASALVAPVDLASTDLEVQPTSEVTEPRGDTSPEPPEQAPLGSLPRMDAPPATDDGAPPAPRPEPEATEAPPTRRIVSSLAAAPPPPPETEPADGNPEPATATQADAGPTVRVPERWGPAQHIGSLTDPELTAEGAGAAAAMLLLFSLLIGFPATMFDGTYRRHYDQIADGLRRRLGPIAQATDGLTSRLPSTPLIAMVLFGTLTAAAVDDTLGFDGRTLGVLLGLGAVVALGGWLGWWPTKKTSDAYGNDGNYRAYPMGLVVALGCVLLTRFGNLHPGYLYGLLFAYETRGRWTKRDDGLTFLLGFAAVFGVGLVAWLGLSTLDPAATTDPGPLLVAFDTVLAGLTVIGVEGVVFGMIPFRFAPGHAIWMWSPRAWFALWVPGVLALGVMLSTPERGLLAVDGEDVSVVRAAVAFAIFSIISFAFWTYWRGRETRSTLPSELSANLEPVTPEALDVRELEPVA